MNKKEVRFIRKVILFIQTGVLGNKKEIFSIRKEALLIRKRMLTNSTAPLLGAQTVRPSKFSYAACFFLFDKTLAKDFTL